MKSLIDVLWKLVGERVEITTVSGQTLRGSLSAVVDGVAILAINDNTCYIAVRDITSVCTITRGGKHDC
jgi:small nuclear ribonucleoprotein (snRNP)-like protein